MANIASQMGPITLYAVTLRLDSVQTNGPVGTKCLVRWACSKTNGCEEGVLKSRRSRNDRNPIVESKGVRRETESEGS